jgi:HK97 family phage prohead protease
VIQYKNLPLELKDIDSVTRTAVIAHAVYDNIDRTKDISRKGMFNKSWAESKSDLAFYLNHDDTLSPGKVLDVYEDEEKAYTKVWLGTHTLGEDTMKMLAEGVIKNASFGYYTVKANNIEVKGQKIRELKEVAHIETSVLTKMPANPKAGVISVVKSFEQMGEIKSRLDALEHFCRNTKATDECIIEVLSEIKSLQTILSGLDTADTSDGKPAASEDGDEVKHALAKLLLKAKVA